MSESQNNILENKDSKIFSIIKLFLVTGGAQILIQAVGFISGIMVIRLLSPQEYAYYVLANTVLGTMVVLADGGVSTGVMAQGAKVWQDKVKLGLVLSTGIHLRKRFAIFSIVISAPILIYLLMSNGASIPVTILICATLIPAFYASLWDSLLVIIPQLHQSILPLQKNQIMVGVLRLLLSGLCLIIFPWSFVAILAGGLPRIFGNIKLRKLNKEYITETEEIDPVVKKDILGIVKKFMPGAIYYSLSGQITMWLISVFGNTTSIAQIGALGKFGMVLTLISAITRTLVIPRFARLPIYKNNLIARYFQILLGLFLLMFLVVVLTYVFPNQILWILGGDYKDLQYELILCIIGACLGVSADIAFGLLSSRGWMYNPILYIAVNILSIIALALILDITTLRGALWMNVVIGAVLLLMNIIIFLYNYYKSKHSSL
jgi:O-antigen/teichoic acid export membrane protein